MGSKDTRRGPQSDRSFQRTFRGRARARAKVALKQFFRQQISKSHKKFPPCAGRGKTAVEARVKNQVRTWRVGRPEKEASSVSVLKWLGEMPEFAAQSEVARQGMSDRKCLAELRAMPRVLNLLVKERIGVNVKLGDVG